MAKIDPEVLEWLDKIEDEHIHCRVYGHHWDMYTAKLLGRNGSKGAWEIQRCVQCDSFRKRWFNSEGVIEKTAPKYAKGYLLKGSGGIIKQHQGILRMKMMGKKL